MVWGFGSPGPIKYLFASGWGNRASGPVCGSTSSPECDVFSILGDSDDDILELGEIFDLEDENVNGDTWWETMWHLLWHVLQS